MTTAIEAAIHAYSESRSEAALRALDRALVAGVVLVPTAEAVTEIQAGTYDAPVICLKTTAGDGAIPAFTTMDQLLKWKSQGSKYIALTGKALLKMALTMPEISLIVINVDGAPRGAIPRSEFERLIALS